MADLAQSFRDFLETSTANVVDYSGVKQNSQATAEPIPVVYGLQRVTPPRIFISTSEVYGDKLICVYALSEGTCLGIYRLFIDDTYVQTDQAMKLVNDGGIDGTTNTVTVPASGLYTGIARFEFMSGRELGESKLMKMHFRDANKRPQYENLAYLVCEFTYSGDDSPYTSIPNVIVDLFGKQVRAANNLNNSTETFTRDPIACLADYLTNTTYGAGFPHSALDQTTFTAASTYCYANIDINLDTGQTLTTALYSCNAVVDTNNTVRTNVEQFLKTFNLLMPFIDGKFHLIPEKADTTQVDFTESSIVGQVRITYPDTSTKYNAVYFSYKDPENGFALTRQRYPRADADVDAYITEDGGLINNFNLELGYITDPLMGERIARTYLSKSRKQLKYEFDVFKDAWKYRVGDVCRIKLTIPDIDYHEIRITRMTLTADNLVRIEAYSHADEYYHPFTDFYPTPPDYTKPLIPSRGGVTVPVRPSQPIGIIPPDDDPNPSPEPIVPVPILPTPPTPPSPSDPAPPAPAPNPVPAPPTFDINVSGPGTVGNNDEFYSAYLTTKTKVGSISTVTINDTYTSPLSGQYTNCYFDTSGGYGKYILKHALTYRNQVSATGDRIGFVYELGNTGRFGFMNKLAFSYQWSMSFWDPEFPTNYWEQYTPGVGMRKITDSPVTNASLLMQQRYRDGSRVYYSDFDPIVFFTSGGTFLKGVPVNQTIYPGAILSPLAPNLKKNFQESPFSFEFTIKYFYYDSLQYIGKKTFRIGASAMTPSNLDNQRLAYKQICEAGTEVPF